MATATLGEVTRGNGMAALPIAHKGKATEEQSIDPYCNGKATLRVFGKAWQR